MIEKLFRKKSKHIDTYSHGKSADDVKNEYGIENIIKLGSNENQFGPSPRVIAAMSAELKNCNTYPEVIPVELVSKISHQLNIPSKNIAIGNSGESLIRLISFAFIEDDDEVIVPTPSFFQYSGQAKLFGGNVKSVPLNNDGSYDIEGILNAINNRTKIIWICTPNNPTGSIITQKELDKLVTALPDHVVLVLDEAYYEYATAFDEYNKNESDCIGIKDNIIILRTFSKVHGIAGLRIGYILASEPIVAVINSLKMPFDVNHIANVAAMAALDDKVYFNMVIQENKKALERLSKFFDEKGLNYYQSYSNFIWVDVQLDSAIVFDELQKRGIIVRPGHTWGWDTWIRVSTGTKKQMELFTKMLEEVLASE